MKAKVKAAWLEALRSGKYQQTHARLKKPDGYCCLGVLCDISGVGSWVPRDTCFEYEVGAHGGATADLPHEVCTFAGLDRLVPVVRIPEYHALMKVIPERYREFASKGGVDLASLNDAGVSFADIADIIEQFVEVTP